LIALLFVARQLGCFSAKPVPEGSARGRDAPCLKDQAAFLEPPASTSTPIKLHDHVLDAVELDFGPRPLAKQHPVADLDVDRDELASLIATPRADGDDLSFLGFFLGGIRNDDAAAGLLFSFDPLDDDAIVKWTEFHCCPPK